LEYLEKIIPEYHEKDQIRKRLLDLISRISLADDLHELFLQKQSKV
jgi:hypothetical protein